LVRGERETKAQFWDVVVFVKKEGIFRREREGHILLAGGRKLSGRTVFGIVKGEEFTDISREKVEKTCGEKF